MTDLEKKAEKILRAFLHYESNTSYEKLLSFPNKEQIIASHIAFAQWYASQNTNDAAFKRLNEVWGNDEDGKYEELYKQATDEFTMAFAEWMLSTIYDLDCCDTTEEKLKYFREKVYIPQPPKL